VRGDLDGPHNPPVEPVETHNPPVELVETRNPPSVEPVETVPLFGVISTGARFASLLDHRVSRDLNRKAPHAS
jgi:hypothetical protein